MIEWFAVQGLLHTLPADFITWENYGKFIGFPFKTLGVAALAVMLAMAATSHDFWLRNLSAPTWKRLHMLVYVAYALLVAHVTLGALQSETSPVLASVLIVGVATVLWLHLAAAFREKRIDQERHQAVDEGFVEVCRVDRIAEKCATVVSLSGERVAVFRYDGKVSAISNVCQHQNGPLGEGRIIDGCVTCPWHGYQYQPESGAAPPPFKEKVPTFRVKVVEGTVFVHPRPNPPGTRVEPAQIEFAQVTPREARP
jgi:nitrite reductase/ring-hydroxylating ferredoxin subunit